MEGRSQRTPAEVYGLPVLGKVTARLVLNGPGHGEVTDFGADEFEFIRVVDLGEGRGTVFVCNQWNEPGVAQVVHSSFVTHVEYFEVEPAKP